MGSALVSRLESSSWTCFFRVIKFRSWNLLRITPDLKFSNNSGVIFSLLRSDKEVRVPVEWAASIPLSKKDGPKYILEFGATFCAVTSSRDISSAMFNLDLM